MLRITVLIFISQFMTPLTAGINTTAGGQVQLYWAKVGNLQVMKQGFDASQHLKCVCVQNQLFTLVGLGLFAIGLTLVNRYFLNERCDDVTCTFFNVCLCSWRMMMIITSVFLIVLDSVIVFLTIYDVVRNQYFFLGESVLTSVPSQVVSHNLTRQL